MGKSAKFRCRENIYRKAQRISTENGKRERNINKTMERIKEAISAKDQKRVITLTKPLREQELLIGFTMAAEAYKQLNDVEGVTRVIKQAVELGHPKIIFARILLELYYTLGEHEKLLELWEKVKSDSTLSFQALNTMIKFFALNGNLEEAKKIYEKAIKMPKANIHFINGTYIKYVLVNLPEIELYKFINELQKRDQLTSVEYADFLETLYTQKKYEDVLKFSLALSERPDLQSTKVKKMYFEALRKLRRYAKVLDEIDQYIESLELEKTMQNVAKLIKAQCLYGLKENTKARKLFEELIRTIPYHDPNYARCLCGYVFCNPELDLVTATRFLKMLEEKEKQSWSNKNLLGDIGRAIHNLKNTYGL